MGPLPSMSGLKKIGVGWEHKETSLSSTIKSIYNTGTDLERRLSIGTCQNLLIEGKK